MEPLLALGLHLLIGLLVGVIVAWLAGAQRALTPGWSWAGVRRRAPNSISIIDTVAQDAVTAAGAIPFDGIAWARDRGIQRVEVQVDERD